MSYFDPHIFCIENLKEEDKQELTTWCLEMIGVVESANADFEGDEISNTLSKIKSEIIDNFCNEMYERIACKFQTILVSIIDKYPEDEELKDIKTPTTFYDFVENVISNSEEGEDVD